VKIEGWHWFKDIIWFGKSEYIVCVAQQNSKKANGKRGK
jgi:hypothetical protein